MAASLDDCQLEAMSLLVAESLGYIIHELFDDSNDGDIQKGEAKPPQAAITTF